MDECGVYVMCFPLVAVCCSVSACRSAPCCCRAFGCQERRARSYQLGDRLRNNVSQRHRNTHTFLLYLSGRSSHCVRSLLGLNPDIHRHPSSPWMKHTCDKSIRPTTLSQSTPGGYSTEHPATAWPPLIDFVMFLMENIKIFVRD